MGIITIDRPIALAAVLLCAVLHNRTPKKRKAETERATANLYDSEGRRDGMGPEADGRPTNGGPRTTAGDRSQDEDRGSGSVL